MTGARSQIFGHGDNKPIGKKQNGKPNRDMSSIFLQDKGTSFHQQYNYQKLDTIWDNNIDYI